MNPGYPVECVYCGKTLYVPGKPQSISLSGYRPEGLWLKPMFACAGCARGSCWERVERKAGEP